MLKDLHIEELPMRSLKNDKLFVENIRESLATLNVK